MCVCVDVEDTLQDSVLSYLMGPREPRLSERWYVPMSTKLFSRPVSFQSEKGRSWCYSSTQQSDHNHKSRSEKRMRTRALGSTPSSPSTRSQTGRDWPKAAWHRKPGHRGGIRRLLPVYFFI